MNWLFMSRYFLALLMRQLAPKTATLTQVILQRQLKSLRAYTQAAYLKQRKLLVINGTLTVGVIYLAMRVLKQRQHLIGSPQWLSLHMLPNPTFERDGAKARRPSTSR